MNKVFKSVEENRKYAQGISIRESFPSHWKDELTIIRNKMNFLKSNDDRIARFKVKNMRLSIGLTITVRQNDGRLMNHNISQDFIKYIDDDDLILTLDVMLGHVHESYPPGSKKRGRRQRKTQRERNNDNPDNDKKSNDNVNDDKTKDTERE